MGPLATWSLIAAVVVGLFLIVLMFALARAAARGDRMSQRWLEEKWLADARREPYDQDQELGG
jgi:hypothetical protein